MMTDLKILGEVSSSQLAIYCYGIDRWFKISLRCFLIASKKTQ